jgi:cell filamentation protein
MIHAFRNGSGRAQLSFFALLADQTGQPLDLESLDLDAMITSFDGDQTELVWVITGPIS